MMSPSSSPGPAPTAPTPPANPPMFGQNNPKKKGGGGTPQQFNSSVLGAGPPALQNLAQKTLLGQ